MEVTGPSEALEDVSIFLNVYCDLLRGLDVADVVHDEFAWDAPETVRRALAPGDALGIGELDSFATVFSQIVARR